MTAYASKTGMLKESIYSQLFGRAEALRLVNALTGNLSDFRECHVEPDWLLLYQVFEDRLILSAVATGTHAELFDE